MSSKNNNDFMNNYISNDIWYHIADQIAPEHVQTFALICKQTAALIRTKKFWKQLYQGYCGNTKQWVVGLPPRLQLENTRNCDVQTLRCLVIEALYYCHKPFTLRLAAGYSLDTLLGRIYTASWHLNCQCVWVMCYKFCKQLSAIKSANKEEVNEPVNDWESLSEQDDDDRSAVFAMNNSLASTYEGVSLLIICCNRFIPFPTQILYAESTVRLLATRDMLSTDMRGSNLELDFGHASNTITTVKYPQIIRYKVLPWWHPDFRRFIK